jgi:hypothetical protein
MRKAPRHRLRGVVGWGMDEMSPRVIDAEFRVVKPKRIRWLTALVVQFALLGAYVAAGMPAEPWIEWPATVVMLTCIWTVHRAFFRSVTGLVSEEEAEQLARRVSPFRRREVAADEPARLPRD